MNNEENFKEKPVDEKYVSLYNDVEIHRDHLHLLSQEIIKNNVSNYPIFVAHKEDVNIGKQIIAREKHVSNWHISITILEDLVNKKLVALSKVDEFRKVFKDPNQFFCFLVITPEEPQFIFIKRSKHNSPLIP